jgi:glutamate carboxypeptidase
MDSLDSVLPRDVFRSTLELLTDLTALSSPSGDLAGIRGAGERLATALSPFGMACEIREEAIGTASPQPLLYARGPETQGRHLLLIGHLDTVLPATPPRHEGDRLVATGAIDMKGGLATLAGALALLRHRGVEPPSDLLLVVVPDEEVGGEHSHRAMVRWGKKARALWVLEPGEPGEGGSETIVAGRRGMFQWRVQFTGRSAHSGLHYWQGRSALAAAARWVADAEGISLPNGGPTVNTGRLVGGEAGFVDDLGANHSLFGTDMQLNVVPDRAVAEGEVRFLRVKERAGLAACLEELARNVALATGTSATFETWNDILPVDPNGPHHSWSEKAVDLAAARGWHLDIERERGGISFPNFLPDPGRIPVLDGLGPVGGGMHTREEFVSLTSLKRRIVLLADLLQTANAAA